MTIKNIIFDFGGVILKHRKDIMEEFISKIFSISFNEASEVWQENKANLVTGKITSKEFLLKLQKEFNTKLTTEKLLQLWKDLYKKEADNVNKNLLDYIEKLKSKYKVILFTDTIDIHDEYNKTRNIYQKFHKVIKSFKEGTIKTQKTAFINMLKKIKAKPDECVFIDDLEPNVKKAESLGIKGIVFKNNEQMKKELKQFIKL